MKKHEQINCLIENMNFVMYESTLTQVSRSMEEIMDRELKHVLANKLFAQLSNPLWGYIRLDLNKEELK